MEGYMNQTDTNLAKIESTMEAMMATSYFNSASLTAYLLIKNMRVMQDMLFDTLTDVYKGHMDVHLLTPVNLIDQLNDISGKLPKSLTLPVENIREDIKTVYKLLYAKARVTSDYFLFEVHIPLTSDEDFLIYKMIPLPVKTENGTTIINLQSQYIAVNFHKNTYISVTETDLKFCTQVKTDNYLCYKNVPIFNLHNYNAPCEAKLLSHSSGTTCDVRPASCNDAWIELHEPNSWLAVCCEACTLRTVCNFDVTSHSMTSSGIVNLAQGCVLQSKDFTIHSHNEYNSKIINIDHYSEIPTLNSTANNIIQLTRHNVSWKVLRETHDTELQEIDERLHSLHENEVLPTTISNHDIHQYTICYALLSAAIIGMSVWITRKLVNYYRIKHNGITTHTNEAFELEEMKTHYGVGQEHTAPAQPPAPRPRESRPPTPATAAPKKNHVTFSFDD
ncbi:uncharacterized protein LOC114365383 [Ostrinia furnacalis]|uniref:uncharacterized protein LOC114365383 n=1 Tax=Ostrinia furnacalis TaxID=93504 RepID=UPI00103FB066|nr:uncharacterized protein LOC114365383 [Ostrinia furnacalis]